MPRKEEYGDVCLKEYVDSQITALRKETTIKFKANEENTAIFRDALNGLFVTKAEHAFVVADIRELRESRAELKGKASQSSVYLAYLFSLISILISIIAVVVMIFK